MSAARWLGLMAASIAGFLVAAIATFLLLLASGQWLWGWHDNPGPEIAWSLVAGLLASSALAACLHGRWTSQANGQTP